MMTHIYKSALILLCAALVLPAPARAQDITSGLQGYWRLDESSGTAQDSTANNNDGTLDANAVFSAGRIGNGVLLDGTGDSVNIANESFFDYTRTQPFTISAWVFRETSATEDDIVEKYDGVAVRGYALFLPTGEDTVEVSLDDSVGTIRIKGGDINLNQWHHVAATYNGSSSVSGLKIYIDGVLQSATPTGTTISGSILNNLQLTIGEEAPTSTCCGFDGRLDEVRIYNRALSANDILYLYDGTKAGKIRYNEQNRAAEYLDSDMWVPMGRQTYAPNAVHFDGTNWLNSTAGWGSDGQQVTGSFWVRMPEANPSSAESILGDSNGRVDILRANNNDFISFVFDNSGGTAVLNARTSDVSNGNWHHVMFSFDLSNPSATHGHIYVDGVLDETYTTWTQGSTMDFTVSNSRVSGTNGDLNGDIADIWFDPGTYIDLSVAENRRKFYDNGPVFLGADGSGPTGAAPEVFLSGETDDWQNNRGTIADFTEGGVLTDAVPDPGAAPSAIVQSVENIEYGIGSSTQMVFGAPVSAGNSIIVGVATRVGCGTLPGGAATVTDNQGNTYDMVVLGPDGGENIRSYIFAADNINSTGTLTLTFTHNTGSTFCVTGYWSAIEVDGIATVDQTGTGFSLSTPVSVSTSGQTSSSPQLAVAMLGLATSDPDDDTQLTHEEGWTQHAIENDAFGGSFLSRNLSGTGDVPANTWSWEGWDEAASASIATFTYTPSNLCANPARPEGTIIYNTTSDQMQFCNGEDWVAMGPPGNGGGGCSNPAGGEGEMVFNSSTNYMQYCEGSDWIKVGLRAAPESGLLYHWRLDETSGTVADDSVGANNGTLTAGLDAGSNSVEGRYGNGLDFDGTDDYISTPSITIPAVGTIALWLKADTPGGGSTTRIWANHDNFEMNLGTGGLVVGDICGNSIFNSTAPAIAGQWYHVVMTWNDTANETILYLDGQEDVTSTSSITCGQSGNFLIGNRPAAGAGQQFDGVLDDVRYYNRILSPGEVYNLYRATGGN